MSATSEFYLTRAADCAREAGEAKLANVRERCLRAEAAWRQMAERLIHSEANRSRQEAAKAASLLSNA